ncbi:MAG: hypothetical protein AAB581_00745 [Patescibacteria group bacterium]
MNEQFPSEKEPVSEERVIEALKEQGLESTEALALLNEWIQQNERVADQENTPRANVECTVKTAKLYYNAGYKEGALGELETCLMAAQNINDEELEEQILALMDDIESGL